MKKFQILLSTYNGEEYLREQLDSFLSLDNYPDVKVLVRDDGSTDSTREILSEYRECHGFEVIFGENVGLNASLHELLVLADRECEYFAFSDQDDVWLPSKLSRAESLLSERAGDYVLYSACSLLVDDGLNAVGHTLIPKRGTSFYNAMVQNVAIGHTQVFGRRHLELLSREFSPDMVITDHWSYLLASGIGDVVYDSEPTTLYRQHGGNVIGYGHTFLSTLGTRIRRVFTGKPKENSRQLSAFLACYSDVIRDEYRAELDRFLASQKNVFKRFFYLLKAKAYRQTAGETLIFRLMYLFGRYKLKNKDIKKKETTE